MSQSLGLQIWGLHLPLMAQPGDTLTFSIITTEFTHSHRVSWGTGGWILGFLLWGPLLAIPSPPLLSLHSPSPHMTHGARGWGCLGGRREARVRTGPPSGSPLQLPPIYSLTQVAVIVDGTGLASLSPD